jgi:hypothetical protein
LRALSRPARHEEFACAPSALRYRFGRHIFTEESKVDSWLNNASAMVFVKDLSSWLVVNKKCEPVIWIDQATELDWFFTSILELGCSEKPQLRVIKNSKPKAVRQILPQRMKLEPRIVLPMRVP